MRAGQHGNSDIPPQLNSNAHARRPMEGKVSKGFLQSMRSSGIQWAWPNWSRGWACRPFLEREPYARTGRRGVSTLGVRLGEALSPCCSYCWDWLSLPSLEVWGLEERLTGPQATDTGQASDFGSLSAKVPGFHTLPLEPGRGVASREHGWTFWMLSAFRDKQEWRAGVAEGGGGEGLCCGMVSTHPRHPRAAALGVSQGRQRPVNSDVPTTSGHSHVTDPSAPVSAGSLLPPSSPHPAAQRPLFPWFGCMASPGPASGATCARPPGSGRIHLTHSVLFRAQ